MTTDGEALREAVALVTAKFYAVDRRRWVDRLGHGMGRADCRFCAIGTAVENAFASAENVEPDPAAELLASVAAELLHLMPGGRGADLLRRMGETAVIAGD